jgi:Mn-dependent DtxR family transcriptional regulator
MGILQESGYVTLGNIGSLELTEKGLKKAKSIYSRHILLTDFLVKITGVSKEQAEENACKIEHDIDEDVRKGIEKWMKKNS